MSGSPIVLRQMPPCPTAVQHPTRKRGQNTGRKRYGRHCFQIVVQTLQTRCNHGNDAPLPSTNPWASAARWGGGQQMRPRSTEVNQSCWKNEQRGDVPLCAKIKTRTDDVRSRAPRRTENMVQRPACPLPGFPAPSNRRGCKFLLGCLVGVGLPFVSVFLRGFRCQHEGRPPGRRVGSGENWGRRRLAAMSSGERR